MVFTKVNIGRRAAQGTRQPLAGLPEPGAASGPLRPRPRCRNSPPGREEMPVSQTRRASP